MKRSLLLSTVLFFVVAANAQSGKRSEVKEAHDRYVNIDTAIALLPEGTAMENGNVALKKGYRELRFIA